MKLYENVVIGNYLYGLGIAVGAHLGAKKASFPSIVSLLQQTPDDTAIGDVLITAPGALRVLEFKREDNADPKEEKRFDRLCKVLTKYPPRMSAVSREVHWYIETKPIKDRFDDRVVPYLEAFPRQKAFTAGSDLAKFVERTAQSMVGGQPSYTEEEAAAYLGLLASIHKNGRIGSGGLLFKISPNGSIHYAELVSILDLIVEKKILLRQYMEQSKVVEAALEKNRTPEMGW